VWPNRDNFKLQAASTTTHYVWRINFSVIYSELRSNYTDQSSRLQPFINDFNHFIIPTNAHNIKNVELLKHIKIMEAAPTCFGL